MTGEETRSETDDRGFEGRRERSRMKSAIKVCSAWKHEHDRPVYTLGSTCPVCGGDASNSAPAPFDPADSYGEYRRALRSRDRD